MKCQHLVESKGVVSPCKRNATHVLVDYNTDTLLESFCKQHADYYKAHGLLPQYFVMERMTGK